MSALLVTIVNRIAASLSKIADTLLTVTVAAAIAAAWPPAQKVYSPVVEIASLYVRNWQSPSATFIISFAWMALAAPSGKQDIRFIPFTSLIAYTICTSTYGAPTGER